MKNLFNGVLENSLKKIYVPQENEIDILASQWNELNEILEDYAEMWNPFQQMGLREEDLDRRWDLSEEQAQLLTRYLKANLLFVNCLEIANIPNKEYIKTKILLPPS